MSGMSTCVVESVAELWPGLESIGYLGEIDLGLGEAIVLVSIEIPRLFASQHVVLPQTIRVAAERAVERLFHQGHVNCVRCVLTCSHLNQKVF